MTDQEFIQKYYNLEKRVKQLEAVVGKVETDSESEFERVGHGEPYFYIYGNTMNVAVSSEDSDYISELCHINNNYFYTKKRAQEVADKIKFLLKLERLHDIYCPYYEPDWNDSAEGKWCVYYSHNAKKWLCGKYSTVLFPPQSSFPTEEIAQEVCDVLNKEREGKK